jgi:hypothetical protein
MERIAVPTTDPDDARLGELADSVGDVGPEPMTWL